jgi:tripartite-type tricarboxylate transporter receptor subunit TctC
MRKFLAAATLSVLAVSAAGDLRAQSYPTKPVRIVVPFAAGGAADIIARLLGQKVAESWGQPIVVDNRAGAGGNIGVEFAARSAPDGYTYLLHTQAFAVNISLQKEQAYHPVRDFAPVMLIASTNGVLEVTPSLPVRTVKELIALAKAQPGKLSYASSGIGSSSHLNMELFNDAVGIDVAHVPYKTLSQSMNDLMSGQVQVYLAPITSQVSYIRSGKVRPLAVSGPRRSEAIPDIPTMQEAGVPGYEAVTWYGMYAPAGTPRDIIARTHSELSRALQNDEVKERFLKLGLDTVASTSGYLAKYLQEEVTKWANVIKKSGITAR